MDQLLVNGGDHTYHGKPLFHGAIMNSGGIIRTLDAKSTKAQDVFDRVAKAAGCPPSSYSTNVLDCLRKVPVGIMTAAMNSEPDFMTSRSNDVSYVRRPDPSSSFYPEFAEVAVAKGHFAKVPFISGNMQDEATIFTPSRRDVVSSTETLVDYISSWFPLTPRPLISDLVATYPDDPAAGLPANTGGLYELYPQSKRLAAIDSDLSFILARREALTSMVRHYSAGYAAPIWSYLATYLEGNPWWGSHHTADVGAQFNPRGAMEFAGNAMNEAYIRFVNHGNPNGGGKYGAETAPHWPRWDEEELQMANFSATEVGVTRDDFRWESYEFWKEHSTKLRQ